MQGEINLGKLPISENSEKVKFLFWVEGTFGDHLSLAILLSVILKGSCYQNSQKWLPFLTEST